MSADTRSRGVNHAALSQLAQLFASLVTLVRRGSRSSPMIEALLRAMQLFKENRLGLVREVPESNVEKPEPHEQTTEERQRTNERWSEATRWAAERVRACMQDPVAGQSDPAAIAAAMLIFNQQPSHQCYWNNRFCVAVMCGLPWTQQQEAAWCAVSNGLNGYWEWKTHSGYDAANVLKHLGIVESDFTRAETGMYHELDGELAHKIALHFDLPTERFDSGRILNENENSQRFHFNKQYPFVSVL